MTGVELGDVTIDGEFTNLVLDGVDVAPLVQAELAEPELGSAALTDPTGWG